MAPNIFSTPHITADDKQFLFFSRNCMHNTVIAGAGHVFEATTPSLFSKGPRYTSVYRVDPKTDAKRLFAEIHWRVFKPSMVRIGGEPSGNSWIRSSEFLRREGGGMFSRQVPESRSTFGASEPHSWKFQRSHVFRRE
jgi:hypothetical protein